MRGPISDFVLDVVRSTIKICLFIISSDLHGEIQLKFNLYGEIWVVIKSLNLVESFKFCPRILFAIS